MRTVACEIRDEAYAALRKMAEEKGKRMDAIAGAMIQRGLWAMEPKNEYAIVGQDLDKYIPGQSENEKYLEKLGAKAVLELPVRTVYRHEDTGKFLNAYGPVLKLLLTDRTGFPEYWRIIAEDAQDISKRLEEDKQK